MATPIGTIGATGAFPMIGLTATMTIPEPGSLMQLITASAFFAGSPLLTREKLKTFGSRN